MTLNIGIIGVGVISAQYFDQLPSYPGVTIIAVADLDLARAAAVAEERGVESMSVDELIADPRIELILNLTIPAAHAEIDLRVLAAGKHVYGEKPLALTTEEGRGVIEDAARRGLIVGSAPDTVLGTGIQTARALIDSGAIGDPVAASVQWTAPGHERWHPAPEFYYQPGAGPLFDMGPYYLTALVTLFGPIKRVAGVATRSARERSIGTGPKAGAPVPVNIDTHVSAVLEHVSGVTVTVTVSFEVWASRAPLFEVYGTSGTLAVPDPNRFSDDVEIWTTEAPEWTVAPVAGGYPDAGRGIGIADIDGALSSGRPVKASGELALHVLEVMESILASAAGASSIEIVSRPDRPDAVALGADPAL